MREKQRTIKSSVSFSGIGIHTGGSSTITFNPAPENYGYKFVRTDLAEPVEIPALVDYVVDLSRGTTLGIGDVKVHTVEHVLAALAGLQIDNCRIELSGIEPPVGDGSSLNYVEALLKASFEEQNAPRDYFIIEETIQYHNEEKAVDIVALPTDDFRVTVMVDYFNPALGSQHTGLFDLEKEFISEFAPARTFCFLSELEMLVSQGLVKGGNLDNALVIIDKEEVTVEEMEQIRSDFNLSKTPHAGANGYLDSTELRFKNEPARHKLLDMLGDMALAGFPVKAQILAARPGHASNIEFAKKLRAAWKKKASIRKYQTNGEKTDYVFDIDALMKIMPHRYPFLLIDRVMEFDKENNRVVTIKNVTINEPFFQGHFPVKPVMPGVLIMESMAQTGCLLILEEDSDFTDKLVVFSGIRNARFRRPVIPGDQLVLTAKITGKKLGTYMIQCDAKVNGQIVAETELSTSLIKLSK